MRVRIVQKHGYIDRHGLAFEYGDVADLSDDLAVKLLNHHIAVPAPDPEPEVAVAAPPENVAKRVSKPKPKASKRSTPAKEEAE
jgi:hypothetical protein